MADPTLKERCSKRLAGLKKNRQPYEADAREIASYGQPARSRFLSSDTNKNVRQRNARLASSHGIFAFRTLQGGMTSGLSSPSRPWFSFTTHDEALKEDPEVKAYLAEVERRMGLFFAQTNFYQSAKTGYLEMGLFGTEACVMVEHPREGAVCHALTFGEYWIGLGSALTPEALYRVCPMTVIQAMQRFDRANLSPAVIAAYDRSDYDKVLNFFHAIEINDDRDPQYGDARGKLYRSVYWDEDDGRKDVCASTSGYEEQPFWAPRWDTTGSDAWGQGPGHDALPDLRELQLQTKRKAEATDMHVWPEIISPPRVKLRRQPKSVVSASALDAEGVKVPYQVPYQTIGVIREDVDSCKEAINQATYADLFMAITNMQGIQPRNVEEIASRNEEKLTQLGPVIERVNNEKLEIAIERAYGIMHRARLLPDPPESLDGVELKIEFVSILTQMQRMVGLGQIERTAAFVAGNMASFPELRHKIDALEMVDEYASRAGAPPKMIRSSDDARDDMEAEAQQQQAAQMAEMASKAAPALKDVTDAARLAAETAQAAPPAIPDLVPL